MKRCELCTRTQTHFEGCSHVDCPQRKLVTAQPIGEPFVTHPKAGESSKKYIQTGNDGVRREPTTKE